MMRTPARVLALLVAAAWAGAILGENSATVLDDEAVVGMLLKGRPETEVLKAIESASRVSFDLEPDMIRELKAAGVSDKVLEAMRRRQAEMASAPHAAPVPGPTGKLQIRFRPAKDNKPQEPILFQVIKKTPRWAAEEMGMVQRPEVDDLAFFLLCTRPDHVPDHWQDQTELKDFTRHEKLLFRSGSHPSKSHGFEVVQLDLPPSLTLDVAQGEHRLVVGVAAKAGADWHVVASDELKQVAVDGSHTAALLVTLSGSVVGSHMVGFKEEQILSVVDATSASASP
jgi:hypothetical protein